MGSGVVLREGDEQGVASAAGSEGCKSGEVVGCGRLCGVLESGSEVDAVVVFVVIAGEAEEVVEGVVDADSGCGGC